jgi:hypothetical protein
MSYEVLTEVFVFGFALESCFCGSTQPFPLSIGLVFGFAILVRGLSLSPSTSEAVSANKLYPLSQFHSGTPNIDGTSMELGCCENSLCTPTKKNTNTQLQRGG